MALTLAITGATGFVGGHTLAHAVACGHGVRALARSAQPAREGVTWVAGSLTDAAALARLVEGSDIVIHIAGVTNGSAASFQTGNILGTAFLRRAIGTLPLVHVSSLSAREPQLSTYGWSKLMGEQIARGSQGPVVVVRPPAVYGPGDREFLELLKTARSGFLPVPRDAVAAMIYGADLAEALVALAQDLAGPAESAGAVFEVDDGTGGYTPRQLAEAIGLALGRRVRPVQIAPAALRLAALAETAFAGIAGNTPRLTADRAGYMAHKDWSADSSAIRALGIWQPRTALTEGMAQTATAYRAQGLLP